MASKTQLVCMHEGTRGGSIDPVFINALLKKLRPSWARQAEGSNIARFEPCHGRAELIEKMPKQLKACLARGGHTTLMVWADVDDNIVDCERLKAEFLRTAQAAGITQTQFNDVVFIFARDRLENWVEFLLTGNTDESREGPRVNNRKAADAAKLLANKCLSGTSIPNIPASLDWSCKNWRKLATRMRG